jgi:hypothetical protein
MVEMNYEVAYESALRIKGPPKCAATIPDNTLGIPVLHTTYTPDTLVLQIPGKITAVPGM